MDDASQLSLFAQLRGELNGEREHDRALLEAWAERYRGQSEAEGLLREIGRLLYALDEAENPDWTGQLWEDARAASERAYAEAIALLRQGEEAAALETLAPAADLARRLPLPEETVWTDFNSYLEGLLFQSLYEEETGGREIRRHPLRPGKLLYAYASALNGAGRYAEAAETLAFLHKLDPVCPEYLFEWIETDKHTGQLREAWELALLALGCAVTDAQLARCYRNLGYCLAEDRSWDDAAALYRLSLRFEASPMAEAELRWIAQAAGEAPQDGADPAACCERLGIPLGRSDRVKEAIEWEKLLFPTL